MTRRMYKISKTINGEDAGSLYNFYTKKLAQTRLANIMALCRYPIAESGRNYFVGYNNGDIYRFDIKIQKYHYETEVER